MGEGGRNWQREGGSVLSPDCQSLHESVSVIQRHKAKHAQECM